MTIFLCHDNLLPESHIYAESMHLKDLLFCTLYTQCTLRLIVWTFYREPKVVVVRRIGFWVWGFLEALLEFWKKIIVYNVIIKWLFVIVATYRGWIKLNKWPLGRMRGSLWLYQMGFYHDPILLGSCIERKSNGFLVACCKTWFCSLAEKINMLQIFLFTHHAKKSVVIRGWLASRPFGIFKDATNHWSSGQKHPTDQYPKRI